MFRAFMVPVLRCSGDGWLSDKRHTIRVIISHRAAKNRALLTLCLCVLSKPGLSKATCIFCGPLFFAVAHFHHLIERTGRIGFQRALMETVAQLSYTYLFGIFSVFLFLKTGMGRVCSQRHRQLFASQWAGSGAAVAAASGMCLCRSHIGTHAVPRRLQFFAAPRLWVLGS